MPSGKDRLYIGLHARAKPPRMPGGEDKYHWALLVGPKLELTTGSRGTRIHAMERPSSSTTSSSGDSSFFSYPPPRSSLRFEYAEEDVVDTTCMHTLLARIQIAKVLSTKRLLEVLRRVPVMSKSVGGWNCVSWVREALIMLAEDGRCLGTGMLEWYTVRDTAMRFAEKKARQNRYNGIADSGGHGMHAVATYDLLQQRETIS